MAEDMDHSELEAEMDEIFKRLAYRLATLGMSTKRVSDDEEKGDAEFNG